jgi:hypothetical protein
MDGRLSPYKGRVCPTFCSLSNVNAQPGSNPTGGYSTLLRDDSGGLLLRCENFGGALAGLPLLKGVADEGLNGGSHYWLLSDGSRRTSLENSEHEYRTIGGIRAGRDFDELLCILDSEPCWRWFRLNSSPAQGNMSGPTATLRIRLDPRSPLRPANDEVVNSAKQLRHLTA